MDKYIVQSAKQAQYILHMFYGQNCVCWADTLPIDPSTDIYQKDFVNVESSVVVKALCIDSSYLDRNVSLARKL